MSEVGAVFADSLDRFGHPRFIPHTVEECYRRKEGVEWLEDKNALNETFV